MDKIIDGFGSNLVLITAIICYCIYEICALNKQPNRAAKYEELKLLNELREKKIITEDEFNDKKDELLG